MSNSKITPEKANDYRNNINEGTVYRKPEKGFDSGAIGKASEGIFSALLAAKGFTLVPVSAAGKIDIVIYVTVNGKRKRVNVESKVGRGEITSTLRKSDYIVYAIRPEKQATAEEYAAQFYTLRVSDFLELLDSLNLIKAKKSTRGTTVEAIQNFWSINKKTGQRSLSKKGRDFLSGLQALDIDYKTLRGEG